jgi:hypothetical protein
MRVLRKLPRSESTCYFLLVFGTVQLWENLMACYDEVKSTSKREEVCPYAYMICGCAGKVCLGRLEREAI